MFKSESMEELGLLMDRGSYCRMKSEITARSKSNQASRSLGSE